LQARVVLLTGETGGHAGAP